MALHENELDLLAEIKALNIPAPSTRVVYAGGVTRRLYLMWSEPLGSRQIDQIIELFWSHNKFADHTSGVPVKDQILRLHLIPPSRFDGDEELELKLEIRLADSVRTKKRMTSTELSQALVVAERLGKLALLQD